LPIRFDDGPDASSLTGFAGNRLIRDAEKRDSGSLAAALADAGARFFLLVGGKALVEKRDGAGRALFSRQEADAFAADLAAAVLLGHDQGVPTLAAPAAVPETQILEPLWLYDLRSLLYSSSVGDADAGAIAQATSLLHWHQMNRFCGKCGAASLSSQGGYRRDCPSCASQIFPRTDPVAIMLAVSGTRCLLGRGRHFPPGWYSTLAGFIEPGETIEDAVRRETFEESGIRIGRVRYHASQPWPFPHSLMIGCFGEAVSEEVRFDAVELEDCRWFDREEVRAMLAGTHPKELKAPPSKAIAHHLIRAWAID
jgi:NAD+ diphosphatase